MSAFERVYADNLLTDDGTLLVMHHVFPEAHRRAIQSVVNAALREAATLCRNEHLARDGEYTDDDEAYDHGVGDCVNAIENAIERLSEARE